MAENMIYDYYYGDESSQFSFCRIPRQLITGQHFKKVSTDAKLLYGLLLDRMGLSARNGWYNDAGRVYIFYTLDEIQEDLSCGHEKAVKLLPELDADKGCGLIERVKQGQGRPAKIYVKRFTTRQITAESLAPQELPRLPKIGSQEVGKSEAKASEKQKSRLPKNRSQDFRFSEVQTSENRTVIILNLIKLISAIKINLSIHHLPLPSSLPGQFPCRHRLRQSRGWQPAGDPLRQRIQQCGHHGNGRLCGCCKTGLLFGSLTFFDGEIYCKSKSHPIYYGCRRWYFSGDRRRYHAEAGNQIQ